MGFCLGHSCCGLANVTYHSLSGESIAPHRTITSLTSSLLLGPCSQGWQKRACDLKDKRFISNVALRHFAIENCSCYFRLAMSCMTYCTYQYHERWLQELAFTTVHMRGVDSLWVCCCSASLQLILCESFVYQHLKRNAWSSKLDNSATEYMKQSFFHCLTNAKHVFLYKETWTWDYYSRLIRLPRDLFLPICLWQEDSWWKIPGGLQQWLAGYT